MIIAVSSSVNAAQMYIISPESASSNREPLALSILLDGEGDVVSGLSGNFSFPSELFDVKTISTQNGIVSLWIEQPHVSEEKTFDQRTHIFFEGIIPGGFNGVLSPFHKKPSPGIIATIVLIPKGEGRGFFTLTDTELHAYDAHATVLSNKEDKHQIVVPHLSGKAITQLKELVMTDNKTVTMTLGTSDLVNNNAPYVYVHEADPSRTIDHIEFAESDDYNPNYVSQHEWRTGTNPYVLMYSSRTKYIHAKIIYTNKQYTFVTVSPVENSQLFLRQSRILVYILVAISLLYFYGKYFLHLFSKHSTKHT